MTSDRWQHDAGCIGADPSVFFPERTIGAARGAIRSADNHRITLAIKEAKQICSQCPVTEECFAFAMQNSDAFQFGVWGGTTAPERRHLARTQQKESA